MQKWEYYAVRVHRATGAYMALNAAGDVVESDEPGDVIAEAGQQGWELVSAVPTMYMRIEGQVEVIPFIERPATFGEECWEQLLWFKRPAE